MHAYVYVPYVCVSIYMHASYDIFCFVPFRAGKVFNFPLLLLRLQGASIDRSGTSHACIYARRRQRRSQPFGIWFTCKRGRILAAGFFWSRSSMIWTLYVKEPSLCCTACHPACLDYTFPAGSQCPMQNLPRAIDDRSKI